MDNIRSSNFYDKPARVISVVFHPFLMPVYGLLIILLAPTLYNYLPFEVKKLMVLIVLVNNVLLPLSLLPFFVHHNYIKSWMMNERNDRKIPLIISTILFAVTTYIIFRFPIPNFLKSYFIAFGLLALIATLINLRWKISLHSIGAGAIIALVLILSVKMSTSLLWFLIPAIITGGMILSSRLQLDHNNPGQVWSGFLTGFAVYAFVAMMI